jgi:hypothetical protein
VLGYVVAAVVLKLRPDLYLVDAALDCPQIIAF